MTCIESRQSLGVTNFMESKTVESVFASSETKKKCKMFTSVLFYL